MPIEVAVRDNPETGNREALAGGLVVCALARTILEDGADWRPMMPAWFHGADWPWAPGEARIIEVETNAD